LFLPDRVVPAKLRLIGHVYSYCLYDVFKMIYFSVIKNGAFCQKTP